MKYLILYRHKTRSGWAKWMLIEGQSFDPLIAEDKKKELEKDFGDGAQFHIVEVPK